MTDLLETVDEITRLKHLLAQARTQIVELSSTNNALEESIQGQPSWLQMKSASQRRALRGLNRTLVAQRVVLKFACENGRLPTADEVRDVFAADHRTAELDQEYLDAIVAAYL